MAKERAVFLCRECRRRRHCCCPGGGRPGICRWLDGRPWGGWQVSGGKGVVRTWGPYSTFEAGQVRSGLSGQVSPQRSSFWVICFWMMHTVACLLGVARCGRRLLCCGRGSADQREPSQVPPVGQPRAVTAASLSPPTSGPERQRPCSLIALSARLGSVLNQLSRVLSFSFFLSRVSCSCVVVSFVVLCVRR